VGGGDVWLELRRLGFDICEFLQVFLLFYQTRTFI
jgi:hypothetical protein